MIVKIPGKDNRFYQTNTGEISGNIWASWNMDLVSNPGRIRVSPQTTMLYSNLDSTAVVYPVAAIRGNFDGVKERYWVVCDDVMIKTSDTIPENMGNWEQDLIADTPTTLNYLYSDGVEWNGSLIVSTGGGELARLTAGTWDDAWWGTTLGGGALNTTIGVPLGKAFNNLLLIGDENIVKTVDTADNINEAQLTFPDEFQVVWIRSSNSMIYIGCRNKRGDRTKVFLWDGYSENFNADYEINGSECFTGIIKDEVCYVMNERGELLAFNGGAFVQIARLPNFNHNYDLSGIGRNSMAVQDNKIHILVNSSTNLENQLSGIWVYDPEIGLVHKYSITKAATGVIDYGSPDIVRSGFLLPMDKGYGTLLIGASLYLADGNTPTTVRHAVLNILNKETDVTAKVGYFITPKIQASEVEENWQKIYLLIKKFLNSTDKIYVKYRTDFKKFGDLTTGQIGTWTSTTSFTVPVTTDDYYSYVAVGDEIEIVSGEGSGLSANVVSIDSTVTVIDEAVTGATGAMLLRASNWKKVGTDVATQELRNFELPLNERSSWIQFKCVMFFKGKNEMERFILKSTPQLSVK